MRKRWIAEGAAAVAVLAAGTAALTQAEPAPATSVAGGHVTKAVDKAGP